MKRFYQHTIKWHLPIEKAHWVEFLHNFLVQTYFTFVQALPLLITLGLFVGVFVSFQTQFGLALLGDQSRLGKLLVYIIFREITPLAMAVLLIARSVTAVASELATNKVQQELEALEIMGINTFHYLLAPRIATGVVSLFCMATTFLLAAMTGSWIGANWSGYLPLDYFLTTIALALEPTDFLFFTLKTAVTGGLVLRLACLRGLSLHKAPYEVPIVTNRAVVDSLTLALGWHFSLSITFYLLNGFSL